MYGEVSNLLRAQVNVLVLISLRVVTVCLYAGSHRLRWLIPGLARDACLYLGGWAPRGTEMFMFVQEIAYSCQIIALTVGAARTRAIPVSNGVPGLCSSTGKPATCDSEFTWSGTRGVAGYTEVLAVGVAVMPTGALGSLTPCKPT
jgi:hypothetical protein